MYVKVFSQILESSIAVDYEQRHIFQDLLILADREGVIDMTHEAIARRLNVPEPIVVDKIAMLEQPDPKSRSEENEGRRLIRLADHRDWGWKIVNYAFYRDLVDAEALRAANRERKREQRARERATRDSHEMSQAVRDLSQRSQNVTPSEAVSSSETKEKERERGTNGHDVMHGQSEVLSLSSEVLPKPKKKFEARPKSSQEFYAHCEEQGLKRSDAEYLYNHWQSNGWMTGKQQIKSWKHAVRTWETAGWLPSQKPK